MIFFNHLKCSTERTTPPGQVLPSFCSLCGRSSSRLQKDIVAVDKTNMCRGSLCDTSRFPPAAAPPQCIVPCMCRAKPLFLIVSRLNRSHNRPSCLVHPTVKAKALLGNLLSNCTMCTEEGAAKRKLFNLNAHKLQFTMQAPGGGFLTILPQVRGPQNFTRQ